MSEYVGEAEFNKILKAYLMEHKDNQIPFAHAKSFIKHIKSNIPDSLKYLTHDLFESISLYDNKISTAKTSKLSDNQYKTKIEFTISKYRSDRTGKQIYQDSILNKIEYNGIQSLKLNDYIDIQLASEDGKKKISRIKITEINNTVEIITSFKPDEVMIDPYYLLIEKNKKDNSKKI